jgi:hypothetical protein
MMMMDDWWLQMNQASFEAAIAQTLVLGDDAL